MYLDILSSQKVSSLATGSSLEKATYAECLESVIEFREAEFAADKELLTIEFKNYHLGLEAEDNTFWAKVNTVVRKLLELLKTIANKITSYIQTVPGRIHNFVLRVANWAAKIGLEARVKKLVEYQNRKMQDENKVKDFVTTEFGPMNFDEILLGRNTVEKTEKAAQKAEPGGAKKKFVQVFMLFTTKLGTGFWARFEKSVKDKLNKQHEKARTAGADTAAASGTETLRKVGNIGDEKVFNLDKYLEENGDMKELFDMIEDAARAIGETKTYKAVPSADTLLAMVKTVTNGNIEKQSNGIISAIDRLKRNVDTLGRLLTAQFNSAYAQKDDEKVIAIREAMSECRRIYTLYIKMIVRTDTAAQRCTSNVIQLVNAAMACYKFDPSKENAEKVNPAKTTEEQEKEANADAAAANANAGNTTSDSNVSDFSHIFDF